MLFYFASLFYASFWAYFADRKGSKNIDVLFLLLVFGGLILMPSLRHTSVGTDTITYKYYYQEIVSFSDAFLSGLEFGYAYLNFAAHRIYDNYNFLLFLTSSFILANTLYAFKKANLGYMVPVFVYVSMGFYAFMFNGIRQAMAMSLTLLALAYLKQKRQISVFILIVMACLFHKTAVAFFVVFILSKSSLSIKKTILSMLLGSLVIVYSYKYFVDIVFSFDEGYEAYTKQAEGGGVVYCMFLASLSVFFINASRLVKKEKPFYDTLVKVFIFGTMVSLFSVLMTVNPSGMLRLSQYFSMAALFLWPIIFFNLNQKNKYAVGYFFVVCYLVYFYLTTVNFSSLVPYKTFV